ncbi:MULTISPECIES: MBL fold metallo-hydrolase [Paenibacillus]|uniref:Metal-binding protein n=2 Tax=Paenibacillus TaxID=44249 RepID=A0A198AG33_9BACL|nr:MULTISPECIES: MBL fold metallo-hydrolase [Paenibacillus]MDR6551977.1 glyoxylase-like metal-dependent hydrolase (beta-lactamase superfamily II) [Paenibacillus qinlingensis]NQX60683.1 MBL fold metallo-hydrolase [Paenibacillus qinlingensis]OAS19893.1 metal-binding protein [Paenibacillus oryzisoli]
MINIQSFVLGPVQTNAYLLSNPETNQGIIIDPGMNPKSLIKKIADMDIVAILLTHAHFDHIGGVDEIRKLKGCPVYIHDLEADWLTNPKKNGSARWPDLGAPIVTDPAEFALDEGQVLEFLGIKLKVFHTPGHSPGSVSFLYDNHLFSGDVLFKLSVGRTDLLGGDNNTLLDSIQDKLFLLDDEVIVYSGHGAKTTIGFERENNPYV